MCTLIWKPSVNGGFLGSNRDEWPGRGNATPPAWKPYHGTSIFAPIDPSKGGSWFACIPGKRICVILNGGFVKHQHSPPYAYSRGIVLLDALVHPIESTLQKQYLGVEPFTLVIRDFEQLSAYTLVWDGIQAHIQTENWLDERLWSSSTLYDESAHQWGVNQAKTNWTSPSTETMFELLKAQEFHSKRALTYFTSTPPLETMASIVLHFQEKNWELRYSDWLEQKEYRHSFLN